MARGCGSMKDKWSQRADEYMNFLLVRNASFVLCGLLLKSRETEKEENLQEKIDGKRVNKLCCSCIIRTVCFSGIRYE